MVHIGWYATAALCSGGGFSFTLLIALVVTLGRNISCLFLSFLLSCVCGDVEARQLVFPLCSPVCHMIHWHKLAAVKATVRRHNEIDIVDELLFLPRQITDIGLLDMPDSSLALLS